MTKKKTYTQKYIDMAVEEARKELAGTHISNCAVNISANFGGAAEMIAEGLIENAKALGEMARALKNQPIYAFKIDNQE